MCSVHFDTAYLMNSIRCTLTQITKFLGPTWGLTRADSAQVGPTLAPWTLLSGEVSTKKLYSLTLSQWTLAGPVYIGMPLECHWLTQCTLGYHWATQRIPAGYTGTPLEKLSWNSPVGRPLEKLLQPTLEHHWRGCDSQHKPRHI